MKFANYERFLDCVHCGLCLSACPTYLELGGEADSPRGRIYLMRGLEDGSLALTPDVAHHLDLCLGCRACETACPSGVRYGEMIESVRSYVEANHPRSRWERLQRRAVNAIFPHPARLRALLLPLRLLELLGVLAVLRRSVAWVAFLPELRAWQTLPEIVRARGPLRQRVGFVAGCVGQVLFAGTNRATLRVLRRNGCRIETPGAQGCCGALYLHGGDRQAALACARHNIDSFGGDLDAIVTNAAGCGAMLKEYGHLLAEDAQYAERARAFSAKVRDVTEYLASLPLQAPTRPLNAKITYHDACHLAHGQGVRDAPRRLLRLIPGLELIELAESDVCCGSAGSYNLTEPDMARRLGQRKAANIQATGASVVAAANPGCVMQIQAALARSGFKLDVRHPIELLDQAYGEQPRGGRTPR